MTRLFFILATLHALLVVPAWLYLRTHGPLLLPPTWHGHEMLFGFALAVVAGFLVTRPSRSMMVILLAGWLAGRAAPFLPAGLPALACGLLFPLALLAATLPALLGSAKRWENRIAPLVLVALFLTDLAWWLGGLWLGPEWQQRALLVGIDLFALLLLIFGGRALRSALGGYLERRGLPRRDEARGNPERLLALFMLSAVLADAGGQAGLAGLCCLGAALLTLWRMRHWPLGYLFRDPRLWTLGLGYLWLVAGLSLKGLAQLHGGMATSALLHGIGVGALGTLTLVMMARTAGPRGRQAPRSFGDIGLAAVLISLATLARLLVGPWPEHGQALLWWSALAWSMAFLILLVQLLALPGKGGHRMRRG